MKAFDQFYRINKPSGLNVKIASDGSLSISLCTLIAKGNELNIEKKVIGITKISQLSDHISEKSLVALNLSGKGVLTKQISRFETIDRTNFSKVLPNAIPEDFYIQNFVSGEYSFVSVIRKKDADAYILQFKALNINPLLLSLGPFNIENIIPLLNIYDSKIIIDGNIIERNENGEWKSCLNSSFALAPFPFKIALEKIDEQLIIAYAAAFQLVLAGQIQPVTAESNDLNKVLKNILATKKIKVQSTLIGLFFFVLLLINIIVISTLGTSNQRLSVELNRFAKNTTDSTDINDEITRKEQQLVNLGWENGIKKSIILDQLDALMPTEIRLNAEAIDPIDPVTYRSQKAISFEKRTVKITGSTDNISPVYEWIARIKIMRWVKGIQMESYSYNNEMKADQFTIKLNY